MRVGRFDRLRSVGRNVADRPGLLCLLLVGAEAAVVLGAMRYGAHTVLGGDAREYQRYATNLADHLAFSNARAAPFAPSVFRTPGYPALLAFFHLIAPGSLVVPRIAQFALLWLTALLVYRVGVIAFNREVALVGAILCATFLPLVWFAASHLSEPLATFLLVAVVLLVFRAREHERSCAVARFGALGLTTGLLSLVRPENALLVVPIAVGLFIGERRTAIPVRLREIAILLVGFAVVLVPWAVRNAIVAHEFVPVSANSGQSLYISSQQYAGVISYADPSGDFHRLYGPHGLLAQITGRTSPYASPLGGAKAELASNRAIQSAARRVFAQLSLTQVIRSLPSRVEHLWGTADFPPPGRSYSGLLHRVALVQYAWILMMTVVGMVLTAVNRRLRDVWPLLLVPVYTTVVHLVFNVAARFTVPDRPSLIVFAAVGVVWLAGLAARRLRSAPGLVHRLAGVSPSTHQSKGRASGGDPVREAQ